MILVRVMNLSMATTLAKKYKLLLLDSETAKVTSKILWTASVSIMHLAFLLVLFTTSQLDY